MAIHCPRSALKAPTAAVLWCPLQALAEARVEAAQRDFQIMELQVGIAKWRICRSCSHAGAAWRSATSSSWSSSCLELRLYARSAIAVPDASASPFGDVSICVKRAACVRQFCAPEAARAHLLHSCLPTATAARLRLYLS